MSDLYCMNCMGKISADTDVCPHCNTPVNEVTQTPYGLPMGSILNNKYLIGRSIGQGGFGLTYIGLDIVLQLKVCIKEYFPKNEVSRNTADGGMLNIQTSPENWEAGCRKFLKEAQRMAKIDEVHSIVKVRETFRCNGTAYIIMNYIQGETLKTKIRRDGVLSLKKSMTHLVPAMIALEKAHLFGIIHRDISPDNIMIRTDGATFLLDLGAAMDLNPEDNDGSPIGPTHLVVKNGFSPIEQYSREGPIGPWTDVYAMGATLFYCLVGKVPPPSMERLNENVPITYPPEANLPPEVIAVLNRALALDYRERIQSIRELREALQSIAVVRKPAARTLPSTELHSGLYPAPSMSLDPDLQLMSVADVDFVKNGENDRTPVAFFGNRMINRSQIRQIIFQNSFQGMTQNAWDVSLTKRQKVMAWVVPVGSYVDVFIGSSGGRIYTGANVSHMFDGCDHLAWIHFGPFIDFIFARDFSRMFRNCCALMRLDLSTLNTSQAITMRQLFMNCFSLQTVDLRNFKTQNVGDFYGMFQNCRSLLELDLRSFNLDSARHFSFMFSECRSLRRLRMNGILRHRIDMYNMFFGTAWNQINTPQALQYFLSQR